MSSDDLEPDQDPLVKEDKASTVFSRFVRGAKNAAPGRSGTDERIYSDPDYTADPDVVARRRPPKMRSDLQRRDTTSQAAPMDSPYADSDDDWASAPSADPGQEPEQKRGRLSSLKQMWSDALAEAEQKQQAKKQAKGK